MVEAELSTILYNPSGVSFLSQPGVPGARDHGRRPDSQLRHLLSLHPPHRGEAQPGFPERQQEVRRRKVGRCRNGPGFESRTGHDTSEPG